MLYPTDEVSPNALLYGVARHNFSSFVVKDFDLEQMNFGRLGLLIIKGFDNVEEINHYRQVMAASTTFTLPPQVRPVVISAANFSTLLKSGRSFDDYFRYMRDKTYRDTEEAVLPPEIYGESEGLAPEETAEETDPLTEGDQPEEALPEEALPEEALPEEIMPAETPLPENTEDDNLPQVIDQEADQELINAPEEPAKAEEPVKARPEAKPVPKPQPKPKAEPKPVPKPPAKPKPQLPVYDPGSEGDDPLLD